MKVCLCCFEEKPLIGETNYCLECIEILEEDKKEREAYKKQSRSYWDKTGQIQFESGIAWAISPTGGAIKMGPEKGVLEVLETHVIPEECNERQRTEFKRIFEVQQAPKVPKKIKEPRIKKIKVVRIKTIKLTPKRHLVRRKR
jgi:hypothetical protein